jgi:hypothetical protein
MEDVDAEVKFLVQSGCVAEKDLEKVTLVLRARQRLEMVTFKSNSVEVYQRFKILPQLVHDLKNEVDPLSTLNNELQSLAEIPECKAVLDLLKNGIEELKKNLNSFISPISAQIGNIENIERLHSQISNAVRELKKIVNA